jgi:hypothetical protein
MMKVYHHRSRSVTVFDQFMTKYECHVSLDFFSVLDSVFLNRSKLLQLRKRQINMTLQFFSKIRTHPLEGQIIMILFRDS